MDKPLTDAINALTTYANEITGVNDPDLSSAVRTLCDGYGSGGGDNLRTLGTFQITENTNNFTVNFDPSWASDYDTFIIYSKLRLTASDWIYFDMDTTSPARYHGSNSIFNMYFFCTWDGSSFKWQERPDGNPRSLNHFPSFLYLKTYVDTKYMTDQSEVIIYGTNIYQTGERDTLLKYLTNETFDYESDEVTTLKGYALANSNIRNVSFPNLTSIGAYAFLNDTSLVSFKSNKIITSIGARAFYNVPNLTEFPFENLDAALNDRQFYDTGITRIYAPRMSVVGEFGSNQINENNHLVTARFPNATRSSRTSFLANNPVLKLADLGKCTNLGTTGAMFGGCPLLEVLILRKDNGVTAVRTNEFGAVTNPVTVYVPTAQKANYEANANWASLITNSKVVFADLEGSPYESIDFDDSVFFE